MLIKNLRTGVIGELKDAAAERLIARGLAEKVTAEAQAKKESAVKSKK